MVIEEKEKKNQEQKEIEKEIQYQKEQYKLEAFKNIPSKLKENTKNWITNEQAKNKPIQKNIALAKIRGKSQSKPITGSKPNKPIKIGENIYNIAENEPKSMFDKYYADYLRSKSPLINSRQIENNYNYEENEYLKPDININNVDNSNPDEKNGHGAEIENLISDEELEKMLNDNYNSLNINQPDVNIDNINNSNNLELLYQAKKSNNLKSNNSSVSNNNRRSGVHKVVFLL